MLGIRGCGVSLQPFSAELTGVTCGMVPCGALVAVLTAAGPFLAPNSLVQCAPNMDLKKSKQLNESEVGDKRIHRGP
jgi:hypothetical protein